MAEEPRHHLPPESPPPPQNHPPLSKMDHKTQTNHQTSDSYRALCIFLTILLLLIAATALALWLIYRPHKPHFTVAAAAIYSLNSSSSPLPLVSTTMQFTLVSTTMQFTLVTRNPNRRVSIHYSRLEAFVAYRNQAITQKVMLPPLTHGRHSSVAVSPVLGGVAVPVSGEVAEGLAMDEAYGVVRLRVVVAGRLRWKMKGLNIKTGRYGIYVKCDVIVGLKRGFVGQVPLLATPACDVDI